MLRSVSFLLATAMTLAVGTPQQDREWVRREASQKGEQMRQQSIQINALAGHIGSMQDARNFVDGVAEVFQDELPPRWATHDLRERLANAEYLSATDPNQLIPEQRVADAWNKYARTLGAPLESQVTATEIHYLRDNYLTSTQFFWKLGNQSIWTMPNIYTTGSDGKIADGSRAVEALSILNDLNAHPEILRGTREQIKKGVLFSDSFKQSTSGVRRSSRVFLTMGPENPVLTAERRYVQDQGEVRMMELADNLINDLLSAQTAP